MANQNFKVKNGLEVGTGVTISAGIVTAISFSGNATNATYAVTAGVSTYSGVSGVSTFSGYSNTSGVSTFSGYSNATGIATYTITAGVSTSVIGGIGSITQLRVSGISTLGITTFTGNVSFGTSAFFGTDDRLILGDSSNLQLYYNSVNSIVSASAGLIVSGSSITYSSDAHSIQNAATTRTFANFAPSGTTFYYNNNTKLQIVGTGITVTGTTFTNDLSVSGIVTATTFVGNLTGTATTTTNIPNLTGDITSNGTATSIASGVIVNDDINASAAIAVSKLAASTISGVTLGNNLNTLTLNTSGTGLSGSTTYNGSGSATFTVASNATSANTGSTIVARDSSGNFSAGTITATLSGTATQVSNTLTLNTSGTGLSGSTTFNGSGASTFTVTSNATSSNTASAIVARDASGNFSAGAITGTSVSDSSGNVRAVPQNAQTSAYILAASDVGKHISITTGGVTVNASIFSAGDAVTIYNNSASNQTITQGASVTLRSAGTANTGNRTLAQYGVCTVLCIVGGATPTFVISGAGLS